MSLSISRDRYELYAVELTDEHHTTRELMSRLPLRKGLQTERH